MRLCSVWPLAWTALRSLHSLIMMAQRRQSPQPHHGPRPAAPDGAAGIDLTRMQMSPVDRPPGGGQLVTLWPGDLVLRQAVPCDAEWIANATERDTQQRLHQVCGQAHLVCSVQCCMG